MACSLKSQRGIVGTIIASWTYYGKSDETTILRCTEGTIVVDSNPGLTVEVYKKNGHQITCKLPLDKDSGIGDTFVNSIKIGTPPEISGEEGYKALILFYLA